MEEGNFIDGSLLKKLNEISTLIKIQSLTEDLKKLTKKHKKQFEEINNLKDNLLYYKLALKAKVIHSITMNDDGVKYISARAAVTIKFLGSDKSKRIWATHYLGPMNEYLLDGKVDSKKVKDEGRGHIVIKLVEKLKNNG